MIKLNFSLSQTDNQQNFEIYQYLILGIMNLNYSEQLIFRIRFL